jgi:hypothetical protein
MADAEHWLWRLPAAQWLDAARHELALGQQKAGSRRAALVHARRGAGMGLNAVLAAMGEAADDDDERAAMEERWGRSYVEHLRAIAEGNEFVRAPLPAEAAQAARLVLEMPLQAQVITLGKAPATDVHATLNAAQRLLEACEAAMARFSRSE